jgi:hypothetical protein
LPGLATENPGIFYDNLVYFTALGNILWPFGIFCGHFVYIFPVLVFCTEKNLATLITAHIFRQTARNQSDELQRGVF